MKVLPAHSKLGASSYERWSKSRGGCPASVRHCEGVKQTESAYALEGTKAHDLAFKLLTGVQINEILDEEMMEAVKVYIDYVKNDQADLKYYEKKFDLTEYHPHLFGTGDYTGYFQIIRRLKITDYKHGAGVPVEIIEEGIPNGQLMYYALGALHAFKLPVREVELVIVQPRCYHPDGPIRSVVVTPIQILDFVADLIDDAKATEDPNAEFNPGPHCRWCPGQATCKAVHKKSTALAQKIFSPSEVYEPSELGRTLDLLPMMEGFIKSVREFAYREAEAGRIPTGYKLVDKRANRKWKSEGIEKEILTKYRLQTHQLFNQKLKSPAEMEKSGVIPDDLWSKFEESFIVKESSGKTLVPTSDNRKEAVSGPKAVFEKITD